MHVLPRNVLSLLVVLLIAGCASQRVVPDELEPLVDRAVTFAEVVAAPESYQGRVLVLGGEVLKAKRLKDGTQIELLQLALDKNERPILDRQQSQGRFFAIQPEFLDPATIVAGTKMTIIGEVSGAKTDHLDDVEYRYPVVIVKHLHTWQEQSQEYVRPRPGFSFGIFGGTGFGGGRGGLGIGF
jgi:outer membrane lipoprotein